MLFGESSGWSRRPCNERPSKARPRPEVSHTERIDPDWISQPFGTTPIENSICRIGESLQANRFAKRKSRAIIELVSHLVRARCSRVMSARVERKRAKTARIKARSRFQFGRTLVRNYGGWRALLNCLSMCRRCDREKRS